MQSTLTTNKLFSILFGLYLASLLTSTAGISIFLWSLFLLFTYEFSKDCKNEGLNKAISKLKTGLEIPLLGFGILTLLSSLWNVSTLSDFLICIWEMRFILGFYFLTYLFKKKLSHNYSTAFRIIGITVAVCGFYGLMQTLFQIDIIRSTTDHLSPFGNFYRATGFFKIPLTYAYIISMLGMFGYAYAISHLKNRNKVFYFATLTFLFAVIGAAASWTRGAWIGLYMGIMIATLMESRKLAVRVFFVTTALFVVLLVNQDFRHRALSIVDITDYQSNTDRIDVWKANLAMLNDNPIFGVGWNQNHDIEKLKYYYEKVGVQNAGIHDHAHNDFISIAAKLGYPGLVLFIWIILAFMVRNLYALKHAQSSHRVILMGCLGAQIVFYFGSLTQANFTDMEVNHLLFTIWAVIQSEHKK